tara:strand:+ start:581 stop:1147 length:567 start_codon:yes stop_codon:yes gene_type:complete
MLCVPARAGKDTLYPALQKQCINTFGGQWCKFALGDQLKRDREAYIKSTYGLSVWEDKAKHVFHEDLTNHAIKMREETDGMYLIERFISRVERDCEVFDDVNYIITDFRYINEYDVIKKMADKWGFNVIPVYIERYIDKTNHRFVLPPVFKAEVDTYPEIRSISNINFVPWYTGFFWKSKLNKHLFQL